MTHILGEWWDYDVRPDGTRTLVGSGRNAISTDLAIIFAMCVKPGAPAGQGLLYWAVGDGGITGDNTVAASVAWDAGVVAGTRAAASTDTGLIREVFRKAIQTTDVVFVNASNVVSAVPTNRLQVTSLFLEAEPSSSGVTWLREWGVVGGSKNRDGTGGAPTTLNTGFLVDHKLHVTYAKQPTSQLERILILTF